MEEALKDYVQMISEVKECDLTDLQIIQIVNRLENEDELWNFLDSIIFEEIENIEREG